MHQINDIPNACTQFKHASSQNFLQVWANTCTTWELFLIKFRIKIVEHKDVAAPSSFFKTETLQK